MRSEIIAVKEIERIDFGFSEKECIGVFGLEMLVH